MSLRGITTITLLKSGISQEDAFCGFSRKFVLYKSEKSKYNQKHEEEENKVVGQGKEGNEESDRVIQMKAYDLSNNML